VPIGEGRVAWGLKRGGASAWGCSGELMTDGGGGVDDGG
jgi:hypothetical protein